ncbi:hypothetical protein LWC34_33125 [Kibdelosporangium philippinense]|uniref:DUF8017 domain-containing protein n=1 Tax=Kibdelosporangium philippinense TaxID=211113 RepID=A0ABS8ZL17_9PSEU|nr:hypothetical protein [Kibdelosporangium philippinense]MCE7007630.1 hypothetical protein [Kibdelosporangium philippinense]
MSAPGGGYQGLGYYDEPHPKKPTGLIVSVVIAAVVVVGLVMTLLIVNPTNPVTGSPLAIANPTRSTSSPTRSAPSNNPLQPKATGAPKVEGWKVIAVNDGRELVTTKAYDVPPVWEPLTSTASFGSGDTRFTLYTPAIYMRGICPGAPNTFRSIAGLLTVKNEGDNAAQAVAAAQRISDGAYATKSGEKPKVTMGQAQPVVVDKDKKAQAVTAKMTITPGAEDKCSPNAATVSVVVLESKPTDKTSVVIAAFADQGVANATPEGDLLKIVTSLHPAN